MLVKQRRIFFTIWDLEASRCDQNDVRGCANIIHYRKPHSEDFIFTIFWGHLPRFLPRRYQIREHGTQGSKQAQELGKTQGWKTGRGGGAKKGQKNEVLRMRYPIVENVRTPSDTVLVTSRGLQLPYRKRTKKSSIFIRNSRIPYFSVFF